MHNNNYTKIPTKNIGPINISGPIVREKIIVPLATFETPLWASVKRGANISNMTDGIKSVIYKNSNMTRSVLLESHSVDYLIETANKLKNSKQELNKISKNTSNFVELEDLYIEIVGTLIYIRFSFYTGDAAGHNISTKASDALLKYILETYTKLQYVSISGNICTDKKNSCINGILGRGKYIISEILVPNDICISQLNTTAEQIVNLNIKKNLIGSILAGSTRSANAHFANMLLAFYLATGQDGANIIEGSQGVTYAKVTNDNSLYFSVTLPNLIVGTTGNGKDLEYVKNNLNLLKCIKTPSIGESSIRLAIIAAAVVLCGELSLLAAQTNPGTLTRSHMLLERNNRKS
ncbi:hydroxymethylglutaryl-CoA reductase [Rickettsia endosymbiont of Cardiosporidium cionae]|uniref:hydroxymethylglutaryl-CoA reductase n=1 Tax=Rickettsia endosymbiont of Cardiosporidium cionae TaxID=2777155 RepID=UPI001895A7AA|nr:hydroxymethylglutaryl-CoA reductase [Rickettsia endosymbiont of Cardiosporidium cionae]KAF8818732.1 hypothetical protein IHI24_000458 [Rickettsia endosymbiont of Cardiosporidium cionae]